MQKSKHKIQNPESVNRKLSAIKDDLNTINRSLSIIHGINGIFKENKIDLSNPSVELILYIKEVNEDIVINHFWNLIAENKKTHKHNIKDTVDLLQNNLSTYIPYVVMNKLQLGLLTQKGYFKTFSKAINETNRYIDGIRSAKKGFYVRIRNWRNRSTAHFDDDLLQGSYYPIKRDRRYTENIVHKKMGRLRNKPSYRLLHMHFSKICKLLRPIYIGEKLLISNDFEKQIYQAFGKLTQNV